MDKKLALFFTLSILLLVSCNSNRNQRFSEALPDRIDFNFHIKPILSDRCFACHGPDVNARKGNVRLDQEIYAFQATLLHLMGIDHEKFTFKHQGRRFRLTDVHGKVVKDILA